MEGKKTLQEQKKECKTHLAEVTDEIGEHGIDDALDALGAVVGSGPERTDVVDGQGLVGGEELEDGERALDDLLVRVAVEDGLDDLVGDEPLREADTGEGNVDLVGGRGGTGGLLGGDGGLLNVGAAHVVDDVVELTEGIELLV